MSAQLESATRIRDAANFLKNLEALAPRFEDLDTGGPEMSGEGAIAVNVRVAKTILGGKWESTQGGDLRDLRKRLTDAFQAALAPYKVRAEQIIREEAQALLGKETLEENSGKTPEKPSRTRETRE